MKLLIATGMYPPQIGGPATYTVFLEKHLPRNNFDYIVVSFDIVRHYPKWLRHVAYIVKLLWYSREIHVLYALDTVSVGLPVRIVSFLIRKPYILRVPGDYAWEQGQQRYGVNEILDSYLLKKDHHWMVRLMAYLQKHVARHALHIIVPSDYLKRVVISWGISSEKITRVYSALKEIRVNETKHDLRSHFGYNAFTIVTSGRLVPWKGVAAVITVIKRLRDKGMDVQLEVLGDGVCRQELEDLVTMLGLVKHVIFHGVVERKEMARRIKSADVFILNTSYEGLSHQLIEVMSLGTPIVTTPAGGNTELITDGQTGVLVPFNDIEAMCDAVIQYFDDSTMRENYASRARERVKLFHEDLVIQEFIMLIKSLWKH